MAYTPFKEKLRPLVDRLGSSAAARVCGVTPQSLNRWIRGSGEPNAAMRAGVLMLLRRARPKQPAQV